MENRIKYEIEGHPGEWIIENSWVSDLGWIMIRFYHLEYKVFMNINTKTTLEQALKSKNGFNHPDILKIKEIRPEETNGPDLSIIY